jgi:hypothetical protein
MLGPEDDGLTAGAAMAGASGTKRTTTSLSTWGNGSRDVDDGDADAYAVRCCSRRSAARISDTLVPVARFAWMTAPFQRIVTGRMVGYALLGQIIVRYRDGVLALYGSLRWFEC